MKVEKTKLEGVLIITPDVFEDERGFFFESYSKKKFEEAGINVDFVQDNHSHNVKGVLRGLHYQSGAGEVKLVRCTKGKVFDVAVDIRTDSKTFGKWFGVKLTAENKKMIFIPVGFAHGFCALSKEAEVQYKCSAYYNKETDVGIMWNDSEINVKWPVKLPIISDRDKNNISFKDYKQKLGR